RYWQRDSQTLDPGCGPCHERPGDDDGYWVHPSSNLSYQPLPGRSDYPESTTGAGCRRRGSTQPGPSLPEPHGCRGRTDHGFDGSVTSGTTESSDAAATSR